MKYGHLTLEDVESGLTLVLDIGTAVSYIVEMEELAKDELREDGETEEEFLAKVAGWADEARSLREVLIENLMEWAMGVELGSEDPEDNDSAWERLRRENAEGIARARASQTPH